MNVAPTKLWGRQGRQRPGPDAGQGVPDTVGREPKHGSRPSIEVLEDRIAPATFLVVNALDGPGSGPAGSLRSAITRATQSGSGTNRVVITSAVSSPIELTAGELSVPSSLVLRNQAGHEVVIRQDVPGQRVFDIGTAAGQVTIGGLNSQSPITIEGASLTGGNGGGIDVSGVTDLTLAFVHIESNTALSGDGGGIYAQGGTMTLVASSVTQNLAPKGSGGGIYVQKGTVTLRNGSHVDENSALNVGGICVNSGPGVIQNAVRLLNDSSASRNRSTSTVDPAEDNFGGGGIAVEGPGSILVSGSQVSNNHTNGMYSGGILATLGNVRVTNRSQVDGNTNEGPGGGIAANFLGSVTVTGRSEVDGNTGAALGGGIVDFATGAKTISIERGSHVNDNTLTNAESVGGALLAFLELVAASTGNDYQSLTGLTPQQSAELIRQVEAEIATAHGVDPSTIAGRVVAGGGIGTLFGARVRIEGGSGVDGNFAGQTATTAVPIAVGGGVESFLGRVEVSKGTVNDNIATDDGGGIWSRRDVRITQGTLAGNHALGLGQTLSALGGGLFLGSASRNSLLKNSTVQGDGADFGGGIDNMGTITVRNSAISRNRATEDGGGIANSGHLALVGSTVTLNRAGVAGGGISSNGHLSVRHSHIVANVPDNVAPAGQATGG